MTLDTKALEAVQALRGDDITLDSPRFLRRLRRYECFLCEQRLDRTTCRADGPPCTPEEMRERRESCIAAGLVKP